MIKTNVSQILKPIVEEVESLNGFPKMKIANLEIKAMRLLEMDCTFGTDGKLFIKIYNTGIVEIRHHTNDGTYYYYPLNSDYTDPRQCKPRHRGYMFDPKKIYKKGWRKK